jgi:restriction system protein
MDRNPDSPWNPRDPVEITPKQFEEQVLAWVSEAAQEEGLDFQATHQGVVEGDGGEYAIDVLVRLSVLGGAELLVLVECKHQARPVEREEVINLEGRLRAVGGHKGMLFSTSGFQSGAVRFAAERGLATVTVIAGAWLFETRAADSGPQAPPPWVHLDQFAGIRLAPTAKGISCHTVERDRVDALSSWLAEARSRRP